MALRLREVAVPPLPLGEPQHRRRRTGPVRGREGLGARDDIAGAIGFAYYKGWFSVTVNEGKAKADLQEMKEKSKEVGEKVVEKTKEGAEKLKEGAEALKDKAKDALDKREAEKQAKEAEKKEAEKKDVPN